jgi:subtilisin family serine protease
MRWLAALAMALIVIAGASRPASAQSENGVVVIAAPHQAIGLGAATAVGAFGVAVVAPIVATIALGHELSPAELWHIELGALLGPIGGLLADQMFPPNQSGPPGHSTPNGQGNGNNINFPRPGQFFFVPNEVIIQVDSGTSAAYLTRLAHRLGLTLLDTQRFALSGRTLLRLRIDNGHSVVSILRSLARYARIAAAQPNYLYLLQQGAIMRAAPADAGTTQYVVNKLHLAEAHQISKGDDVPVAVIDSKIDTSHPDLAGSVAAEFDAVGGPAQPHPHGTGIAGAIAAHGKLIGVAPKVKLLAARVFSGSGEKAQGTTFNILKGIDWATSQNARVINMSFAGPSDPLMRTMLAKAHARGMVLIAAVGNGGPRAAPLYPAAYPDVIGVTATDIDDNVLPLASRGKQVAISAPGVDVLVPAPNDSYQVTTGTSVAAANVSGVAALLLARDAKLTPGALKKILASSAHKLADKPQDGGAGEVDPLAALRALK